MWEKKLLKIAKLLAAVEHKDGAKEHVIRGRDVMTGLPREVVITDSDVRDTIAPQVDSIVEAVRNVLEKTHRRF